MKRNLFLAVAFSVAAVTFYNVSTPANTKYDLLVGDIEALSQDESSSDKGAPMSFTCGALIGYDKIRETNLLPDNGCNLSRNGYTLRTPSLQFTRLIEYKQQRQI
ncbi:MAG: hypothetical protein KIC70_04540 [Alistipes indistinctus]|nr:hypothetical protein [Alistipes indistinctus]